MKHIFFILLISQTMTAQSIYNFNPHSNINDWNIVNDGVMGGLSKGTITINEHGHGVFEGKISLDNNGGFSSVRYAFEQYNIKDYKKVVIKLKGDGKPYQFRVRPDYRDRYSYITIFETTGEWQEVEINLADMYPSFRGRKLDMPNFDSAYLEEVTFLIGNKKEEKFRLLIDSIELQ